MGTEGRSATGLWLAIVGLSIIAAVSGYVGLALYLKPGMDYADADVWERLYYTAQMFVLSSSAVTKPPYNALLTAALFLAPLATLLAALQAGSTVFRARIAAWRLRHANGHAVVVGAGPAAFALAQRLVPPGPRWGSPKTVLVGSDITPVVARRHHLRIVAGDPGDTATLRAAGVAGATRVFALSDTGAVNAGVALVARTLSEERRAADARHKVFRWRRRTPSTMAVYARADDAQLVAALRARRLGAEGLHPDDGYTLDFFSIEQRAAVKLLDEHDLVTAPAAVIGADPFSVAVVQELTRRRRRSHEPVNVAVEPPDSAHRVPADVAKVFVCATDPDEVLRIGLQMLLRGHADVVLCLGRRSMLADALEKRLFADVDGRLTVFGVLDAACDPAELQRGALVERLAQALHAHYLGEHAPPGSTKPSHRPWADLDERFRASNRAQAEDIGVKLAAIDAVVVPASPDLPPFAFRDDEEVERLATMEHERWMRSEEAAHTASGSTGPVDHVDYRDWADLTEEARNKDRKFVRELPALLAAEDLAIIRQPPTG
jgi:TrkA-N domain